MNIQNLYREIDIVCTPSCTLIEEPNRLKADINNSFSSNESNLNIISMNIRSVNKNLDSFLVYLTRLRTVIHILVLSECWCDETSIPPTLDGYTLYHSKKSYNQNDGVIMYIKDDIAATVQEIDLIESNCLIAKMDHLTIFGIYRPFEFKDPSNFLDSLDKVLSTTRTRNIILTGDININTLDSKNSHVEVYLEIIGLHGLINTIDIPTHGLTCLDHFMCKLSWPSKSYVLSCDITDHYPLLLSISTSIVPNTAILPLTRTKIDYDSIELAIKTHDWNSYLETTDVEKSANLLVLTLQNFIAINTTTSTYTRRRRPIKPWITVNIIKCFERRNKLHQLVKKFPHDVMLKETYIKYRNDCNKTCKNLKINYYKDKFRQNYKNNKGTWDTVKELCNIKSKHAQASTLLKLLPTPKQSLDQVNSYFTSVGKELATDILNKLNMDENKLLRNKSSSGCTDSILMYPTDSFEINKIILNLKSRSAPGIDQITSTILKNSHTILCSMISHLCNLSIEAGLIPAIFKKAVVIPVYKGGGEEAVSNYRPISLLSTISKIIEKVINTRLISFLEKKQLLANNQYGFRSGRNTEDAVVNLTKSVTKALDGGDRCLAIFIDLKKAFDTVSIPLLLLRLEDLGIRGKALMWFRDYLTNRTQVVKVSGETSGSRTVTYGIPQGSTLGPTLFLAYINSLCKLEFENGSMLAFADDTALVFWGKTWSKVKEATENGLKAVTEWLDHNLLTINVSKTKYICFRISEATKPPKDFDIRAHAPPCTKDSNCGCPTIAQTDNHKYLGIIIDKNLNWEQHITELSKRIRKLFFIFRNLRDSTDVNLITKIYLALGQSLITYCIPVWGGAAATHLLRLERAQRAVIKVMLKKPRLHPTVNLYKEANLLTVRQLFILQSVLRYHKKIDISQIPRRKRRIRTFVPGVHTVFARRQVSFSNPFLYRHFNDTFKILHMNRNELKTTLINSLKKLNHDETEKILTIAS
jgi:hypothetical protein